MPPTTRASGKRAYSARESYDAQDVSAFGGEPRARSDPDSSPPQKVANYWEEEDESTIRVRHYHMGLGDNNLDHLPSESSFAPLSEASELTTPMPGGGEDMPNYLWCRKAEHEYRLSNETLSRPEVFEWPKPPPFDPVTLFNKEEKKIRRRIVHAVFDLWPNSKIDAEKAEACRYGLVDQTSFWHKILQGVFRVKATEWQNAKDKSGNGNEAHPALALFVRMQREVDDFTPFQSPLLKTFFESFTSYVKCKDEEKQVTTDLKKAMKESDAFRKELNDSFITGHGCYQQSKWIGLDRSNEKNRKTQMNKCMVETEDLEEKGLKSGALSEKGTNVLYLKDNWHRICAPKEKESKKMYSLVFWDKTHSEDTPNWKNQFGAIVYNPDRLNKRFFDRESKSLQAECKGIYENVRNKTAVKRHVQTQGVLVKAFGMQQTFGAPNQQDIKVDTTSAANPAPQVLQRIEEQKQLRIDLRRESSAAQTLSFEFMRGFLPHLAYQQYCEAKKYGVINDLGRPDVSSFAAFGYSAGLHLDKDICVSHGWVFKRTEEVKRNESNFVYGDYKLIVELSEDAHWFWRATEDAHGTTSNEVAMNNPVRWKDSIVYKPNTAQWTYAETIPQAVANAVMKHPQPTAAVW